MLTIELNGNPEELQEGTTLQELLHTIGTDGLSVATMVNDHIVRPPDRHGRLLEEGDRVEVLVFAGGG